MTNIDRFLTATADLSCARDDLAQSIDSYLHTLGTILDEALPSAGPGRPCLNVAAIEAEDDLDDTLLVVGRDGFRIVERGMGGAGEPIAVDATVRLFGAKAVVDGLRGIPAWLESLAPEVEAERDTVHAATDTLEAVADRLARDCDVIRSRDDITNAVASTLADIANSDGLAWAMLRNSIGSAELVTAMGEIAAWTSTYIEGVAATMHGHPGTPWVYASEHFTVPCSYPESLIAAVARTVTHRQAQRSVRGLNSH